MKTPREILLNQHRSAEAHLDRMWTQKLVPALAGRSAPASQSALFAIGWKMWQELILPSRRIWAGLACAWVVIAVLNLASFEPATEVASQPMPRSGEELRALIEQRRMLAQLIGPLSEPAYTQKRSLPGPRSERAAQTSVA
jgi:hypothetical protein